MNRKVALIVLAGVLALSTTGVLAATQEKKNDRKRDRSGENCTLSGSQACPGGGERKRDGSGYGERKRDGSGGGDRKRDGSGNGDGKRDGSGNGDCKRDSSCVVTP